MVADEQALSPQQGGADALEMVQVQFARTNRLDADAALHLLGRIVGAAEQAGETGKQGLDLRPEQAAGVEVRQEMMHGQQGMDFLGAEPQAGQLIVRADPLSGLFEAIAAEVAVEPDRRVQAVAHVGQVALERGPGDGETLLQRRTGDAVARAEDLVDLVDSFHVVHREPRRIGSLSHCLAVSPSLVILAQAGNRCKSYAVAGVLHKTLELGPVASAGPGHRHSGALRSGAIWQG